MLRSKYVFMKNINKYNHIILIIFITQRWLFAYARPIFSIKDLNPQWEETKFTNLTMHLSHIRQCTIPSRNVYISVLNGALWDMKQGAQNMSTASIVLI